MIEIRRPHTAIAAALVALLAGITPAQRAQAAPKGRPHHSTNTRPVDAFRRYATAVLATGHLSPWQATALRDALARGVTVAGRAKRTSYCPRCCPGTRCADGSRVRVGVCAANRGIPMHSLLWVEGDGLLLVTDRGGAVRVGGGYTRAGESANVDVWRARCRGGCNEGTRRNLPYAILRMGGAK